ncbi:MAG: aspartate aminotransferase family protein, partial [bacterium]|nr:aspartate aminotransferase family protein [bacterium]
KGLRDVFKDHGKKWSVARVGSILWLVLQDGEPPRKYEDIDPAAAEIYAKLHAALLEQGVYCAPSAYEVMFVSLAHDPSTIADTVKAFDRALSEVG